MEHKKQGFRFENDWTVEEIYNQRREYIETTTIQVNVQIDAQQWIYDFNEAENFIKKSTKIIVQDCLCRDMFDNCDLPLETCLSFDERAEMALEKSPRNPKEISVDEALRILRLSHDAGLVLTSILRNGDDYPKTLCNCCSCCCYTLSGIVRFGLGNILLSSKKIADEKKELCVNCGECVNRCQFGARIIIKNELVYNPKKCFGCGLCVSTCNFNAIQMIPR
jgi:NAD-dependent dihydropyrimidine dehydrogenase PreA subunit